MDLEKFIKNRQIGEGIIRVIDKNGVVYSEVKTDGISIDFVDARWCVKNGEVIVEHRTSGISCDFISSKYLVSIGELKDPFKHHN